MPLREHSGIVRPQPGFLSFQLDHTKGAGHSGLPFRLNKSTSTVTLTDIGSRILFRSVDDFERLRGSNLAWFGVDEMTYTAEEAWLRLEARLRDPKANRLQGFGVWTPNGFDWVHRRFRAERVKGYELIEARPFENVYLLKETPDYYERLGESYDENFFRQEVLGEYLNRRSGQVYYAFDRRHNVGEAEVDPGEPLLWSWDFNINPMASVICQERDGKVAVVVRLYWVHHRLRKCAKSSWIVTAHTGRA